MCRHREERRLDAAPFLGKALRDLACLSTGAYGIRPGKEQRARKRAQIAGRDQRVDGFARYT